MPEYLSPGVYVEEIPSGSKPIEGVSTSTAGFLGVAERGPEAPVLVTSWLEYQRWFGGYRTGYTAPSYLPYAVQGFFDNGGKRAFIARATHQNPLGGEGPADLDVLAERLLATSAAANLRVMSYGRGEWGGKVAVRVKEASNRKAGTASAEWFRVQVLYYFNFPPPPLPIEAADPTELAANNRRPPDVIEDFDNLTHVDGASNNVLTVINGASRLIRVAWDNPAPPASLTTTGQFDRLNSTNAPGRTVVVADFEGSEDTDLYPNIDALKNEPKGSGLAALGAIDEVSLMIAPDEVNFPPPGPGTAGPLTGAVLTQCQSLRDRFAIVSSQPGQNPSRANTIFPPQDTTYAGFYYPWIKVFDPSQNFYVLVPPSGHVAGLFAETDIDRGVHKAPANEVVVGATDLEFTISKGAQDILNPKGVNCIRDFRTAGRGIRLWGARTMSSDPEWKYVNVRRLFLYVEKSIDHGTQWVVFEPNDEPLWAKVRRTIENFLVRVWKSGALMGAREEDAFFVKCDRTTMTQDDIDNGRLICYIGIAPVKPAEFVIFRISQKTAETQQ
jgi:Bacteriophage tail sheath protein